MKNPSRTLIFALGGVALLLAGLWRWNVDRPFETIQYSPTPRVLATSSGPVVVSVGVFDHPESENRAPNFPVELSMYLTRLHDSKILYVDRKRATNSTARPADWVMGAVYATLPGGKIRVNFKLNRVHGQPTSFELEGASGPNFHTQIHNAISQTIAAHQNDAVAFQSRRAESDYLRDQAIDLCDVGPFRSVFSMMFLTVNPYESYVLNETEGARRAFRLREAIHAFESSLVTNPTNAETKVYLGLCYESSFIDRASDARRLYREIIATPLRDKWAQNARLRLAKSYQVENPRRALDILRRAEDEAPDAESTALFRRVGDSVFLNPRQANADYYANQKTAVLEGLDQTLAELQRTNPVIGNVYPPSVHVFDFIKDKQQRAAETWKFIQELKPRFPTIYPYLVCQIDKDSSPEMKTELRHVIAEALQNTNQLARPAFFFRHLEQVASGFYEPDPDLALHVTEARDDAEKKGFVAAPDEYFLSTKAFLLATQGNWRDALAVFERMGNAVFTTNKRDPWGNDGNHIVSALACADRCREKLNLPSPRPGFHREAGRPIFASDERPIFAVQSDKIWFGNSKRLLEATTSGKIQRDRTLTLPAAASALVVVTNQIFIGTQGAGLIRMDNESLTQRRFGADGKLLSDHIATLSLIGSQLWIGYGVETTSREYAEAYDLHHRNFGPSGGVSYMELSSAKITSFPSTGASRNQSDSDNGLGIFDHSPPNLPVLDIRGAPDASIYMAVLQRGVQRFEPAANRWTALRQERVTQTSPSSVAISEKYLCLAESGSDGFSSARKPLWIRQAGGKPDRFFSPEDGLPDYHISTLLLEGDKLWIGGYGYVALLDLAANKLTQIISLPSPEVTQIAHTGPNLWIATDSSIYTLPL
jgi:hypothetical protein